MKNHLSFALVLLFCACSSAPEAATEVASSAPRTVNEVAITEGAPVTMADLSISGMTCEMGCGGTIKGALAALPGVEKADIKFIEGDTPDHAVVTYDPAKVNDAEFVKTVQALNDGQYKVLTIAITKQVKSASTTDAQPKDGGDKGVSAALPDLQMPSLFGLLSRLVNL